MKTVIQGGRKSITMYVIVRAQLRRQLRLSPDRDLARHHEKEAHLRIVPAESVEPSWFTQQLPCPMNWGLLPRHKCPTHTSELHWYAEHKLSGTEENP